MIPPTIPAQIRDRIFRVFKNSSFICRTVIIVVGVIFLTVPAASATDIWAATIAPHGNPTVAVKDAGVQLKEACKERKPDLVLLFDYRSVVRTAEDKMTIVNGLAESFDRNCIYGATVHGYMKDNTSHGENIGVIALGGIKLTPVKVALEAGKEEASYTALAESLKAPYAEAKDKGRLVLIFGECVPRTNNEKIMSAFTTALGKDVQLFGSPSPFASFTYYQGELLNNNLVAILITGDFTCNFAMADASPVKVGNQYQEPDKIVESAAMAMKSAVGDKKESAALIFVAYSFTRDHSMGKMREKRPTGPADLDKAVRDGLTAPLMTIMDDLEIGHPATGEPAVAKEDQFSVCVISGKK